MDRAGLDDLLDRFADGALDEAARRALAEALARDAEARRAFVRSVDTHQALADMFAAADTHEIEKAIGGRRLSTKRLRAARARPRRPMRRWAVAAAAAVAAGVLIALLVPGSGPDGPVIQTADRGAVILRGRKSIPGAAGTRLRSGDRIRTPARGSVTIAWPGDPSRILLAAESELVLAERDRLRLTAGYIEASIATMRTEVPMLIETPNARAEVLGTEFTLAVLEDGTHLALKDGRVRLVRDSDQATVEVTAGHYARVADEGEITIQPIEEAPRMALLADAARSRDLCIRYANGMIIHGRDTYAAVRSPLFAAALDRRSMKLPEGKLPAVPGMGGTALRAASGANPLYDQNLYRLLYALAEMTGDARYGREADAALEWFFKNAQSRATGLLAWGDLVYWDFRTEGPAGKDQHKFHRPWALWDAAWRLAPAAMERFARGLWAHQVDDRSTGDFSSRAGYSRHRTASGTGYPRHGGFMISAWAQAYARSKDEEFLHAIRTLVDFYEAQRPDGDGPIPFQRGANLVAAAQNLSLAIDLTDAAALVPPELATAMRACARKTDRVFLSLPHDPGGQGFVHAWDLAMRPIPADSSFLPGAYDDGVEAAMWREAGLALRAAERARQTGRPEYVELVRAAADRAAAFQPDQSKPLTPALYARLIFLLTAAFRQEGRDAYLERACALAEEAGELFWQDAPVPRASTAVDHYEAASGADTLALAMLDLWYAVRHPAEPGRFPWIDR